MQLEMEKKQRNQLNYHQTAFYNIAANVQTYLYLQLLILNCCITRILLDKTWALVVVIMHFIIVHILRIRDVFVTILIDLRVQY